MFLPQVPGRFSVGATTFSKFYPRISIGSTVLRPPAPAEPVLQLEEVAFTAYYPADKPHSIDGSETPNKGLHWLLR